MQTHKLLLVDDIQENLYALENILEEDGRQFITANSGEEALKLLLKNDVDVILLDVQMPGMDGFETAKLIRGTQKTRNIPIIFVTAISKEEKHIFKGYESGAIDYLFKPLEPVIVQNKVKILLELAAQRRMMEKQNRELLVAKKNAESIFNNVDEGICIIDSDLNIQPQYSNALQDILSDKNLANENILEVFRRHLEKDNFNTAADYLELLFNKSISEDDLEELNPLQNVIYKEDLETQEKRFIKYLDFKLKRILDNDEIMGVLITVRDRTAQITLQRQLQAAEEKSKRNYELINILKIEPQLVKEFLKQAENEINTINEDLKHFEKDKDSIEHIECIYRHIHSIKGNAGLLGLEFISQKAHEFEQIISDSKNDVDSFISRKSEIFVIINQINETLHEIRGLIVIMKDFYEDFKKEHGNKGELLVNAIYGLVNKAKEENKLQVKFNYRHFDAKALPADVFLNVKDILIQLTRNTLAHNCNSNNKSDNTLNISLMSDLIDQDIVITYEDNGIGLQYDKIKAKAIEDKKYTQDELNSMSQNELAELIFASGLSTTEEADMNSGRGMGMCIIKQKIEELGGRIEVDSQEGKYCNFKIVIPQN
ncbi:MAG: response regulator [Calditrichaceae bacterium]|nr:response regulator [Calditrichaceae bacterium]